LPGQGYIPPGIKGKSKTPPVNAIVRKAEQVNIAEQINQGDKQVNIAKNPQKAIICQ